MALIDKIKTKPAPSIREMIHRRVAGQEKGRPVGRVHASSVTKPDREFCPREYALMDALGIKRSEPEFIPTALRLTFDYGNFVQSRVNEDYLRDVMVGDWHCDACGTVRKFCKRPGHCGSSGLTCQWRYREVRAESKTSGISCGLDGLVAVEEPKLRLMEVKTMKADEFVDLKAPLAEHRLRTNLYMRCIEESGEPWADRVNVKEAHVLYFMKGYGVKTKDKWGFKDAPFSPIKEYRVKRNDAETQRYHARARALLRHRQERIA